MLFNSFRFAAEGMTLGLNIPVKSGTRQETLVAPLSLDASVCLCQITALQIPEAVAGVKLGPMKASLTEEFRAAMTAVAAQAEQWSYLPDKKDKVEHGLKLNGSQVSSLCSSEQNYRHMSKYS